ncbi:MAG: hypothetical protein AB7L09_02715 [Nitrospira sp.]
MNDLERIALIAETKDVIVNTYGVDGNAFSIIGACASAMKQAGVSSTTRHAFIWEATSGDYENVLRTADLWVTLVHIAPAGEQGGSFIGSLRAAGIDPEMTHD